MIEPGAWVETRWGPAVVIEVLPHDHCLTMRKSRTGAFLHPCEDDRCANASFILYRYKAIPFSRVKCKPEPIWVLNGDLTAGSHAVTFLRKPTRLSRKVLKLTGPYGTGE